MLLFLDYDGTLTRFKTDPRAAVLSAARRRLLQRLALKHRVCIVTGRPLAEIRSLVGLAGIVYIGNHGLEIRWKRRTWTHPRALRLRPHLRAVLDRIELLSGDIPDRRIEDKVLTASIHFRAMSPSSRQRMQRIVRTETRPDSRFLMVLRGNNVWDIRPRIPWDKGKAVTEIRRRFGDARRSSAVYVGDDRTDEDAFRELRKSGDLTFRVGGRGKTMARGRIPDVASVWRFLRTLL